MPLDFPDPPKRPKRSRSPREPGSGKGNGTTVGLAVAIFGTAFAVFLMAVAGLAYAHLSS